MAEFYVDNSANLMNAISNIAKCDVIAVDTEFHREKSYFARLGLVQIGAGEDVFLIDPLKVDIAPLRDIFESDIEVVFHAAQQDLEIFNRYLGTVPRVFFDTQIAANFLGYSTPGLGVLLESFLEIHLDKSDRLSDWLARPLDKNQLRYAGQDVAHLVLLRDRLVEDVSKAGRLEWLTSELSDYISLDFTGIADPKRVFSKLREAKALKGKNRKAAFALVKWREEKAVVVDRPSRFVLPDIAIGSLAQSLPKKVTDVRSARGMDSRYLVDGVEFEILKVITESESINLSELDELLAVEVPTLNNESISFIMTWLSSYAKRLKIDPSTLATRPDVVDLFSQVPKGRLVTSWRKEAIGDYLTQVRDGEIALALSPSGEVEMVKNSRKSVGL